MKSENVINMMNSREIVAINTYEKVLQLVEELHNHSNSTETTFLIDIENFLKDKIDYYESGET